MVAVTVFKGKSTTASLIVSASSTRCEDEEEVVLAMTVAVVLFRANVVDSSEEVELAVVVVAVAGLLSPRVPLWALEAVVLPVGLVELT